MTSDPTPAVLVGDRDTVPCIDGADRPYLSLATEVGDVRNNRRRSRDGDEPVLHPTLGQRRHVRGRDRCRHVGSRVRRIVGAPSHRNDDNRARRVMCHLRGNRPDQQTEKSADTAGADNDEIRVLGGREQGGGRSPLHQRALHSAGALSDPADPSTPTTIPFMVWARSHRRARCVR